MGKKLMTMLFLVLCTASVHAQHRQAAAYSKFLQLTSMFRGKDPYSCLAIVDVKYKSGSPGIRDTSRLIYRPGSTYYKSGRVEHVEASQGELIINHEQKTAVFTISDSIKRVLEKELEVKPNKEFEAMLDSDFEGSDQAAFNKYVLEHCNVNWTTHTGHDEISIIPKSTSGGVFLFMKIRFSKDGKVQYYEYANKEAYAKDVDGRTVKFRTITTIYDRFTYGNIPDTPVQLNDFLEWNGWTIKLKRYTNYKLSML